MFHLLRATVAVSILTLSACGGASTTQVPVSNQEATQTGPLVVLSPTKYRKLNDATTGTSTLKSVARISNSENGAQWLATPTGELNHTTNEFELDQGNYVFVADNDGFQSTGTTTDSNGATITIQNSFSAGYQYLSTYTGTYTSGAQYDVVGVFGIASDSIDMPTRGVASYTGRANLNIVNENYGTTILENGRSTVTANFGAGTASLTLDAFSATDRSGNASTNVPMTSMSVSNMTIAGNVFSGGTVQTQNGSQAVDLTGDNTTRSVRGVFYGYDSVIGAPDEVGGMVLIKGEKGVIQGVFIAD